MTVLFRPVIPVDRSYWLPALRDALATHDFRIWPDDAVDPADVRYLIGWKLFPGDATGWPNLRAVLGLGAGVNQYIGHPEFPRGAMLVRMIDPGLSQMMVEYVTSWVLRFHRQHDAMPVMARDPASWDSLMPPLAPARRVGILGLGEMGLSCARALAGLGFSVAGWTRGTRDIAGLRCYAGMDSLGDFLGATDILVCLLPLTPETRGILNRDTLGRLPRGACVINAGRGGHLVDADLIALLDSGHLDRAALDVFHTEPLPGDHPFWDHPKVHITPHLAAISRPETGSITIRNTIETIERGERPAGLVDTARGY